MEVEQSQKFGEAIYVFLDTNILLEGKPLADLPWEDLKTNGPIVATFALKVLTEIDARKRDGRLGKIAREFNRIMQPVVTSPEPLKLEGCSSDVYLFVPRCSRLDWTKFPDMDQDDSDSRIIVEVLHCLGIPPNKSLFISNDLKPIFLAKQNNLRAIHVSDNWIRAKEPSPHDKEVQRLKQRVAELEKNEPTFQCEIEVDVAGHVGYAVAELTQQEQGELTDRVLAWHPQLRRQRNTLSNLTAGMFDSYVTDEDYEKFGSISVPRFVKNYSRLVELSLGQVPLAIRIRNSSPLSAENLIVKVSTSSGWMNENPVCVPFRGPLPKVTKSHLDHSHLANFPLLHVRPGRHDMDFTQAPEQTQRMEIHCQDFPCETDWLFEGIIYLDPNNDGATEVTLRITASNMHGPVEKKINVAHPSGKTKSSELVDVLSGRLKASSKVQQMVEERLKSEDYASITFLNFEEN